MLFAGWFHYHKKAPKLEWFQNVESMMNHHLAGLLGLGCLGYAGQQIHVSLPINACLDAIDAGKPLTIGGRVIDSVAAIPLPHEWILNKSLMADLYPSFAQGLTPFFTLNWAAYADFLTFNGGLNPVTGGLWLSDTAHHHLALAVLFIVAGHMYRTNWGIGHSIKEDAGGPQRAPLPGKATRACMRFSPPLGMPAVVEPGLGRLPIDYRGPSHVCDAALSVHCHGLCHPAVAVYPPRVDWRLLDCGGSRPRCHLYGAGLRPGSECGQPA
jgi:hypothetical protein